jgi:hypothetical protein
MQMAIRCGGCGRRRPCASMRVRLCSGSGSGCGLSGQRGLCGLHRLLRLNGDLDKDLQIVINALGNGEHHLATHQRRAVVNEPDQSRADVEFELFARANSRTTAANTALRSTRTLRMPVPMPVPVPMRGVGRGVLLTVQ